MTFCILQSNQFFGLQKYGMFALGLIYIHDSLCQTKIVRIALL